jgi:putative flavoprotein involved in K+ transport
VDEYVRANGLHAPDDDGLPPQAPFAMYRPIGELNLDAAGITSVVWATGFGYEFDWIDLPVFVADGNPVHRRGVTAVPGVYFLGLRWLHKLKSSFLHGLGEDAAYLAEYITSGR